MRRPAQVWRVLAASDRPQEYLQKKLHEILDADLYRFRALVVAATLLREAHAGGKHHG